MRLSPLFLALVLPLAAAAQAPPPRLQYQDNPRPILLHLPSDSLPVTSVRVYFPTALGVRFEIDGTGRRNPTLWAREEGRPIPGLKTFPGRIGRFGEAKDKGTAFYWTGPEHAGVGYWQVWKKPDRPRMLAFAKSLDAAYSGTGKKRWFEYAAKLPAGSVVRFRFAGLQATVEMRKRLVRPRTKPFERSFAVESTGAPWWECTLPASWPRPPARSEP